MLPFPNFLQGSFLLIPNVGGALRVAADDFCCFAFVMQVLYKNLLFALANWPGKVVLAETMPASLSCCFLSPSVSEPKKG